MQHLAAQDGVHFVIAGGGGASPYPTTAASRLLFAASQNRFAVIDADRKSLSVSLVDDDLKVLHRFTIATPATK